jgi:hypothetical protein
VLADVVVQKVQTLSGRNLAKEVEGEEHADIQVGNQISEPCLPAESLSWTGPKISVERAAEVQVGDRTIIHQTEGRCLADLQSTDPQLDKKRIEDT